ncbi:MAG TPA: hypothetical protein PLE99_09855 [Candidatus Thiothrix moscowensis]|uniref:hypothetical protein n=1 Tax=Thiothrix sp. UBA2016 TaxID=1947695 RepID=UPI0025E197F5|nr:hypothetical protein [Thiothrix sp. UBA2016]HRJ53063.1 hypothetical protein [Candidatus Thiothrix moscowensis]HRJ93054.1 hypothetical protein [Candidatus Thiothrix moscowensis]
MKVTIPFILLTATFYSITAVADDTLESHKAALETIQQFASQICNDIPLVGKSENIELSGSAKVELEKFLKKLADIGIEGIGNYQSTDYTGVLQQDLAALAGKNMDCKMAMVDKLIDRFLPATPPAEVVKPGKGTPPTSEQSPASSDWIPAQDSYQHKTTRAYLSASSPSSPTRKARSNGHFFSRMKVRSIMTPALTWAILTSMTTKARNTT